MPAPRHQLRQDVTGPPRPPTSAPVHRHARDKIDGDLPAYCTPPRGRRFRRKDPVSCWRRTAWQAEEHVVTVTVPVSPSKCDWICDLNSNLPKSRRWRLRLVAPQFTIHTVDSRPPSSAPLSRTDNTSRPRPPSPPGISLDVRGNPTLLSAASHTALIACRPSPTDVRPVSFFGLSRAVRMRSWSPACRRPGEVAAVNGRVRLSRDTSSALTAAKLSGFATSSDSSVVVTVVGERDLVLVVEGAVRFAC